MVPGPGALTPRDRGGPRTPSPTSGALQLFIRKRAKTKFMPQPEHGGGEVRPAGPVTQFLFPSGGALLFLQPGPQSPQHTHFLFPG